MLIFFYFHFVFILFLQSSATSLFQQANYDLNSFLNDSTVASYGIDSFDLSLLGSDYDNYQCHHIKCEDVGSSPKSPSNLTLSIDIDHSGYQYPTQCQLKQEDNLDWQQQQYFLQTSSLLSPISPSTTSHSAPSPCPSLEYSSIKQEQQIQLPPSPPDSNGAQSPQSIHFDNYKVEQFEEQAYSVLSPNSAESPHDVKYLLNSTESIPERKQQDHQVLREFLQDTSFQRKHNLKPLALESLFGGLNQQGDIEPVISLALQHAKQEVHATCIALKISPDPQLWSQQQVQLWISSTIKQFKLEPIGESEQLFSENGQTFAMLSDEEFIRRAPQVRREFYVMKTLSIIDFIDGFRLVAYCTHN